MKNTNNMSSALMAHEELAIDRANEWVPRNIAALAKVDRTAALKLLASVGRELFAEEATAEVIEDPETVVDELRAAIGLAEEERFAAVFLDQGRRIVGRKVFAEGSRTRTVLYPRALFKAALDCNATGIILSHNHPGGSLTPSSQDRELTRKVQTLGEGLEITLVDHIIVTRDGHTSFRNAGWM